MHDERKAEGQDQVDGRHGKPDLEREKGFRYDPLPLHGELVDGDRADQRGVLDQRDPLSGQRGQHAADCLRQDHVAVGVEGAEPQAVCSLPLTPVERDDSRPEDLGGVGALEQAERQNRGGEGADVQDRRHDKIDEKDLDQKRRIADQLQVAPGDRPGTEGIGKPEEGGRQAEDQCAEEGQGGDFQRDPQTPEERSGRPCVAIRREEKTGDAVPLPVVAHLPGSQGQNPNGETRQQEKLPAVDQGCP